MESLEIPRRSSRVALPSALGGLLLGSLPALIVAVIALSLSLRRTFQLVALHIQADGMASRRNAPRSSSAAGRAACDTLISGP